MQLEVGTVLEGKVTGITKFGAFVELPEGKSGMVHISEVADTFVSEIHEFLSEGQTVKVKVIHIGEDGKIGLSIKKASAQTGGNTHGFQNKGKASDDAPRPRTARPKPQPQAPVFTGDPNLDWTPQKSGNAAFEDMLMKYKQSSEEKISDIRKGQSSRRGYSRKK